MFWALKAMPKPMMSVTMPAADVMTEATSSEIFREKRMPTMEPAMIAMQFTIVPNMMDRIIRLRRKPCQRPMRSRSPGSDFRRGTKGERFPEREEKRDADERKHAKHDEEHPVAERVDDDAARDISEHRSDADGDRRIERHTDSDKMLRRALDNEHDSGGMKETETDGVEKLAGDGAAEGRERSINKIPEHNRKQGHDNDFFSTVFTYEPA